MASACLQTPMSVSSSSCVFWQSLQTVKSSGVGSRRRNAELVLRQKLVCVWQGFRSPEEVQRFSDMMEEMCYIVATKHSGSLKASSQLCFLSTCNSQLLCNCLSEMGSGVGRQHRCTALSVNS